MHVLHTPSGRSLAPLFARRGAPPTRAEAWEALLQVPVAHVRALATPTLAAALLSWTGLGGLECDEALSAAERAHLLAVRRELARLAARGDRRALGCVVPARGGWLPFALARTVNPWPSGTGPACELLDHGRPAPTTLAACVAAVVRLFGAGPEALYVARTRFGPAHPRFEAGWAFAVASATLALDALGERRRSLPRWASVGVGAPTARLSELPPDVRLLTLERGIAAPEGLFGWSVFIGGPHDDARRAWEGGASVCFAVESPEAAARCLTAFARAGRGDAGRPFERAVVAGAQPPRSLSVASAN